MSQPKLIIIGAGPKAMAIAAKATVLRDLGCAVPEIHIIERTVVGANWTGTAGYTNGRQPLGTSPEKDVGFPYGSTCWGADLSPTVNHGMMRFSWQSFLVDQGQLAEWIDRGRPAPEHRQWAQYLQWVAALVHDMQATARGPHVHIHHGEVTGISLAGDRWTVSYRSADAVTDLQGDGLVVTGPGQALVPAAWALGERVMTVETFWQQFGTFQALEPARFAIVGSGETAAAVALGLLQGVRQHHEIDIISPMGMAYTRGEGFRENRMYSDPAQGSWHLLTPQHRRDFIYRTDRSVFSQHAQKQLDHTAGVEIVPGRLQEVATTPDGQTELTIEYAEQRSTHRYDYVVLATGADHMHRFDRLIDDATRTSLLAQTGLAALTAESVEPTIQYDLSMRGLLPALHLPMLAAMSQGPGFPNLSCLGLMADRILEPYVGLPATLSQATSAAVA